MPRFTITEHRDIRHRTAQSHLRAAELYAADKYRKRFPLHHVDRWTGEPQGDGIFCAVVTTNGQDVACGLSFTVTQEES